jgi:hypothetical protein
VPAAAVWATGIILTPGLGPPKAPFPYFIIMEFPYYGGIRVLIKGGVSSTTNNIKYMKGAGALVLDTVFPYLYCAAGALVWSVSACK